MTKGQFLRLSDDQRQLEILRAINPALSSLKSTAYRSMDIPNRLWLLREALGILSGGLPPWEVKAEDYSAEAGDRLLVNTHVAAVEIKLPASPEISDEITLRDPVGDWGIVKFCKVTAQGGLKINGLLQPFYGNRPFTEITCVYTGNPNGWSVGMTNTSLLPVENVTLTPNGVVQMKSATPCLAVVRNSSEGQATGIVASGSCTAQVTIAALSTKLIYMDGDSYAAAESAANGNMGNILSGG